ncbi:copper resistance CopC family protein [Fulvimarina pelagi]|uniref:CopC domain-containing protein n=2 Tax=Fulvimarina pelagi TaxID=217511 RepID=A0A0N7KZ39_9HYPH|nr:copper resistance CopC family protein [Fulvimarina pelagi]BAT31449.1 hypothetical protein [Fulvimarina pelagi]
MKRLILTTALASLVCGGALAHSKKETTEPADGTTVGAVEEVVLSFDTPMRITKISLQGSSGPIELTSETGTEATTRYVATPDDPLESDSYSVEWRGLAADGHPMQGSFSFEVSQ